MWQVTGLAECNHTEHDLTSAPVNRTAVLPRLSFGDKMALVYQSVHQSLGLEQPGSAIRLMPMSGLVPRDSFRIEDSTSTYMGQGLVFIRKE
jgi:hypothetical protein